MSHLQKWMAILRDEINLFHLACIKKSVGDVTWCQCLITSTFIAVKFIFTIQSGKIWTLLANYLASPIFKWKFRRSNICCHKKSFADQMFQLYHNCSKTITLWLHTRGQLFSLFAKSLKVLSMQSHFLLSIQQILNVKCTHIMNGTNLWH